MEIYKTWSDFKTIVANKVLFMQYEDKPLFTSVWATENGTTYRCDLANGSAEQTDFINNFQATANQPSHPVDDDGKPYSRAESRPLDMTTYFTCAGDDTVTPLIGEGKKFIWDFSNTDDDVTAPTGYKRKRIEFAFIDGVRVKEGTIYWKDKLFGSYIDLYVVCPDGQYYLDNNKTPQLASGDTIIEHFVNKHHMTGDCLIGDELNTEAASSEIPSNYKFWLEITVPDTDSLSKGHVSVECYRRRTVIL